MDSLIMINTLGMAILVDALKCASHMFGDTSNLLKRNRRSLAANVYTYSDCVESLAFVSGTGLDILMESYRIPLNGDHLRDTFFTMFSRRDLIE